MNEVYLELIKIVHAKIEELSNLEDSISYQKNEIKELIKNLEKIKSNPKVITDEKIRKQLYKLIENLEPSKRKEIEVNIETLTVICEVSELDDDELGTFDDEKKMIDDIIELINNAKTNKENNIKRVSIEIDEYVKYTDILDKLNKEKNGLKHFEDLEIDIILDLIKDKPFEFKKSALKCILILEKAISNNIIEEYEDENFFGEGEADNIVELDDNALRNLFNSFNFDYEKFPIKYQELLRKRGNLSKIAELLDYLCSKKEYKFLYEDLSKDHIIRRFIFILIYSKISILEYLLEDSISKNINIQDIFLVNGVYKNISKGKEEEITPPPGYIDSLSVKGSFEHYQQNSKFLLELSKKYQQKFENDSINLLIDALDGNPELLCVQPNVLKHNILIAEIYGLDVVYEKDGFVRPKFKNPSVYASIHFLEILDRAIEIDCYEYASKYTSVLIYEQTIKKMYYEDKYGKLEFDSQGRLRNVRKKFIDERLLLEFNNDSVALRFKNIPEFIKNEAKKAALLVNETQFNNDPVVKKLDTEYSKLNKKEQIISYQFEKDSKIINISALKFKRIWSAINSIDNVEQIDQKELLIFALSYDSWYDREKLELLETFVDEIVKGEFLK